MGYTTWHNLSLRGLGGKKLTQEDEKKIISDFIAAYYEVEYAIDEFGCGLNWTSWCGSTGVELIEFSKLHPDVLFDLSGEGEDCPDFWKVFAINGKGYSESAEIIWPEFDPNKLEE